MLTMNPISTAPLGKTVLLYWQEFGHFEDGSINLNEETGDRDHILFDGESLDHQPSHWAPVPEFVFNR